LITWGPASAWVTPAHADPVLEASGYLGIDRFGPDIQLGKSFAPEQIPGKSPLFGARFAWIALPALPGDLQLGLEAEAGFAAATTGSDHTDGRRAYFAPVIEWGGHVVLRVARPHLLQPHLVAGAAAATIVSQSPFIAGDTEPMAYWGIGVSTPVSATWRLRLDVRQGFMAARAGGTTETYELQVGLGTDFGAEPPARRPEAAVLVAPPPPPVRIEPPPPPPDPDGDGIIGAADKCPDQPEDFDGFQDADGCPDPDNDGDGLADAVDKCPNQPEDRNGFEDDDGCPDQLPADVVKALATPARFEPRRARVTPAAGKALHAIVAMLEAHPKLRLSIIGHPASPAPDADLARRRAEAIKWYLVDQGIIEDRLTTSVADLAAPASPAGAKARKPAAPPPAITFELVVAPALAPR
jgi:OOP family OmpA-OmpF porin